MSVRGYFWQQLLIPSLKFDLFTFFYTTLNGLGWFSFPVLRPKRQWEINETLIMTNLLLCLIKNAAAVFEHVA